MSEALTHSGDPRASKIIADLSSELVTAKAWAAKFEGLSEAQGKTIDSQAKRIKALEYELEQALRIIEAEHGPEYYTGQTNARALLGGK